MFTFCRCGPLVRYWCMRYESKHKHLKRIASSLGNFINIVRTLSYRHQRYMLHKLVCSTNFLDKGCIVNGSGNDLHFQLILISNVID